VHAFTFILNFLLVEEGIEANDNEWDNLEDGDNGEDDDDDDDDDGEDDDEDNDDKDKEKEVEDNDNDMGRTPSAAGRAAGAAGRAPSPAKRSPKKPPTAAAPTVAAPANVDQLTADFARAGLDSLSFNSLTAIDSHDRQYFNELRSTVVSRRISIRSQSLIAR
jgi:hypothetical protein